MIRFIVSVATLLALAACMPCMPCMPCMHKAPAVSRISRETTPGGLEYTLIHMPSSDLASLQAAWPTDWAYRAETSKTAPAIGPELILTGGAEGYRAGEVTQRLLALQAGNTLYTFVNDYVVNQVTVPRNNLAETVKIVNAALRTPTLDRAVFESIRDRIAKNNAEAQREPARAGLDTAAWAALGGQPFRHAITRDEPDIRTLTHEDVAAWYAESFTRTPEAIVVAGGIKAEAARGPRSMPCSRGCPKRAETRCRER